jgi:hypothetical protein
VFLHLFYIKYSQVNYQVLKIQLNYELFITKNFWTITAPKSTPLLSQRNQSEGSLFQIFCSTQEGSLPLFFEWSKNGKSIKPNPEVNYKIDNFDRFSTLTIAKIDRNDSGNYTCVVHNSIGSDSQSVLLSVKGRNYCLNNICNSNSMIFWN